MAGDFLAEELRGRYDVACLSYILAGERGQEVRAILSRTAAILEAASLPLILEFIFDDDLNGSLYPVLFSINMLFGPSACRSYSGRELFDLLRKAGFRAPWELVLNLPGESIVIAASR